MMVQMYWDNAIKLELLYFARLFLEENKAECVNVFDNLGLFNY